MPDYPLAFPTVSGIAEIEWLPQSSVDTSRSWATRVSQTYDWGGKSRRVRIELPHMSLADAKIWQSWIYELNGREGVFYLSDTIGGPGLGTVAGSPLINGAGQVTETLITDGWTSGDTVVAGDWISINDRLYTILEDGTADGSGNLTLTVWPDADSPGDNAAISYGAAARGIFRLEEFPSYAWDVSRLQAPMTLIAIEAKDWGGLLTQDGAHITTQDDAVITI
jgi:hypothetical protein